MIVDKALILKLENLAKLKLSDDEREALSMDLASITEMFSKIGEINTEGIAPLIHLSDAISELRPDESKTSLDLTEVRENAPLMVGNHFAVPKVIE